jgi:hypothetical protein
MKFLDINWTNSKDSSLLLHAIHSPFFWRILKKTKKTKLHTGFNNPYKKSAKLESIDEYHFVERKNKGRQNSSLRRPELMPRNLD